MHDLILAGDVGATKTRLSLYAISDGNFVEQCSERYETTSANGLDELVRRFFDQHPAKVDAACFGLPGPVRHGTAKLTNIPWVLSERDLTKKIGIHRVKLLNDLAVIASALPYLDSSHVVTLHEGADPASPFEDAVFAVVAPGTGLGEAFGVRRSGQFTPCPSEGGHADFAPSDELQTRLLRHLQSRFGRVSLERVLCGPGIFNVYQFLRDEKVFEEPVSLSEELRQAPDPVSVISAHGMQESYEICSATLDIFCSVLGTEAGNVTLRYLAYGGVYLGGGIPPRLLPRIQNGLLLKAYFNKGRMGELVRDCSLHVIKDDRVALLGAASAAAALAY